MATPEMFERLPQLDDDCDVGVEKNHLVQSDGERDLRFHGTLLASAASGPRGGGRWREYRVFRTAAGSYVFSKVGRSILDDERDKFQAKVWKYDGRSTIYDHDSGEYRPQELRDAAVDYFGLDEIAKQLYSKLEIDATQHIA